MALHPVCQVLRTIRQQKGMTQAQVAALSGIRQGSICEYETGVVDPTVWSLHKWATALNCELYVASYSADGLEEDSKWTSTMTANS